MSNGTTRTERSCPMLVITSRSAVGSSLKRHICTASRLFRLWTSGSRGGLTFARVERSVADFLEVNRVRSWLDFVRPRCRDCCEIPDPGSRPRRFHLDDAARHCRRRARRICRSCVGLLRTESGRWVHHVGHRRDSVVTALSPGEPSTHATALATIIATTHFTPVAHSEVATRRSRPSNQYGRTASSTSFTKRARSSRDSPDILAFHARSPNIRQYSSADVQSKTHSQRSTRIPENPGSRSSDSSTSETAKRNGPGAPASGAGQLSARCATSVITEKYGLLD